MVRLKQAMLLSLERIMMPIAIVLEAHYLEVPRSLVPTHMQT